METQSIRFTGANGDELSARLELPASGRPRATAVFAHCFTCSKNIRAAVNVTRALAREGYAAAESAVDAALTEVDVLRGDEGARMRRRVVRIPSSVENMDPKDAFIQTLSSVPVAPGVRAHSIIPVKGDPPPFGQNDGVVTYESAHIEEAQSEYVVYRSGHSTQSNPLTIREVRRILLEEPSE